MPAASGKYKEGASVLWHPVHVATWGEWPESEVNHSPSRMYVAASFRSAGRIYSWYHWVIDRVDADDVVVVVVVVIMTSQHDLMLLSEPLESSAESAESNVSQAIDTIKWISAWGKRGGFFVVGVSACWLEKQNSPLCYIPWEENFCVVWRTFKALESYHFCCKLSGVLASNKVKPYCPTLAKSLRLKISFACMSP